MNKVVVGAFHQYLFPFDFPFIYISKYNDKFKNYLQSVQIFWYNGVLQKTWAFFCFYLSLLSYHEMTSELITFNYLICHSSSTALGTRTGYWKPTQKGTDETPHCVASLIIYHFGFIHFFDQYKQVQKLYFDQASNISLQIPNSLPRKSLNTDSLISCKFHLKFLQNNCQEISSPFSSYFCFSLRLLCTVHTRDFDLFDFMTLVLQDLW